MKQHLLSALALVLATSGLGACTTGYYGSAGYSYYDGYYDDFYGPVGYGYWGDDDYFYYSRDGRGYVRDDARHFRRDQAQGGGHQFHMRGRAPGGHPGGGHPPEGGRDRPH